MLQVNWMLSFILKGSGLFIIIHQLFFNQSILSTLWVNQLFAEFVFNIQSLFRQQWYEVTPLFRSVLFLLLIWLLSYLIHYWFVVAKQIFLFMLLTFIYLTVLNTFTDYDAGLAVVRSEEHTSELQSRGHLVCRLLLEKKKHNTDSDSRT